MCDSDPDMCVRKNNIFNVNSTIGCPYLLNSNITYMGSPGLSGTKIVSIASLALRPTPKTLGGINSTSSYTEVGGLFSLYVWTSQFHT